MKSNHIQEHVSWWSTTQATRVPVPRYLKRVFTVQDMYVLPYAQVVWVKPGKTRNLWL